MSSLKRKASAEFLSKSEEILTMEWPEEIRWRPPFEAGTEMDRIEELVDELMRRKCAVRAIPIPGSSGRYVGTLVPTPANA